MQINKQTRVLVGCEESQAITKEFRKLGFEAYSCDLLPCSGGHPEWHIQGDVLDQLDKNWDLAIFHPTCTFLSSSGAQWYYHPEDKNLPTDQRRPHPKYPNRIADRELSIEFFLKLANAPITHICIENPVGIMSSRYRKPDCIVNPWQFGDEAQKTTCLWLKNLPKLQPTKIVGKGNFIEFSSGKKQPQWYAEAISKAKTQDERRTLRSKTFLGMAKAIADQYGHYVERVKYGISS